MTAEEWLAATEPGPMMVGFLRGKVSERKLGRRAPRSQLHRRRHSEPLPSGGGAWPGLLGLGPDFGQGVKP
jgi:hypothetical protein